MRIHQSGLGRAAGLESNVDRPTSCRLAGKMDHGAELLIGLEKINLKIAFGSEANIGPGL